MEGWHKILSMFEVLVFTYYWHQKQESIDCRGVFLSSDGWMREAPVLPSLLDVPQPGADPSGVQESTAADLSHQDAEHFLLSTLLPVSGSRQASKVSALPPWLRVDLLSAQDVTMGLKVYAQVRRRRKRC